MGSAVPHRIGRHVHHKARPDDTTTAPAAAATGINYLGILEAQHATKLADRLCYSRLPDLPDGHLPDGPLPGQQPLPGITDTDPDQTTTGGSA